MARMHYPLFYLFLPQQQRLAGLPLRRVFVGAIAQRQNCLDLAMSTTEGEGGGGRRSEKKKGKEKRGAMQMN
jgi:hypothetical protein